MSYHTLVRSARLSFLVLTPVCIFLGASIAHAHQHAIDMPMLALVIAGALFAHLSVNLLNEYQDFASGLDLQTVKTPFSGGSGALPDNPEMANKVLLAGILSLLACTAIGLYIFSRFGAGILPIGIAGLVLVVTYTRWINRYPVLCLLAPGAGFGLLMVTGTQFVLQGHYTSTALLAGGVPFFLVNNLLLLNQYPDMAADSHAGRRTLPIVYGTATANRVYLAFVMASIALIAAGVAFDTLPGLSLFALLPIPLAFYALSGARKFNESLGEHAHYLAANVAASVLTPLLLGLAIIFGAG